MINDISVIALFIRKMNTDHENFQNALLRYQGKESRPIPEEVFIRLDEYFTENNGITAERAKQLPLIKQGNGAYIREGTSRMMMMKALSSIHMTQYYEDITRLCAVYWDWKLPGLTSEMERQILADFDCTYERYHRHMNPQGPPKG